MNIRTRAQPRIESLLEQAHKHERALRVAAHRLSMRGMTADDLPDDRAIRALALLGDHQRAEVLEQLRAPWASLCDRGLVAEPSPEEVATPLLRLLAYTLKHLDEIAPLHEALDVDEAPRPPAGLFQCPEQIRGIYWGQRLNIPFSGHGLEAIRIHADQALGLDPVLLRVVDGELAGECELIADDGSLSFTMIASAGGVFRHVVNITTAKTLKELA